MLNRSLAGALSGVVAAFLMLPISHVVALLDPSGFDLISMLSLTLGVSMPAAVLAHILVGATWGVAFACLVPRFPLPVPWVNGAGAMLVPWIALMIMPMPAQAATICGGASPLAFVQSLMLHLAFGFVMAEVFSLLFRDQAKRQRIDPTHP
ncbi:hypothetical protein GCM10007989_12720 [Devosia pacifica]|uniref:Uncharacterized protein n=1 Tax=Devosia pacifica TaxID=1335967 RepID=A0A918RZZ5_9HYPH|nr:DUF6789 family protein [Devosia pacifica]GHA18838.1 hypothetical protein GCM10007989_12720 [Devosia pacifica]